MPTFIEWFQAQCDEVDPEFKQQFTAFGFAPYHTGGNCMAWGRLFEGGVVIISNEELSLIGSDTDADWTLGVMTDAGATLECTTAKTLAYCLHDAWSVPQAPDEWPAWIAAGRPEYRIVD